MNLQVEGSFVSGTYQTAVGDAQGIYTLAGTTDTEPYGQSQAVGFTVAWVNKSGNSHSVTAWSGQLQMIDGREILTATWLITQETEPEYDWASTLVGMESSQEVSLQKQNLKKGQNRPHGLIRQNQGNNAFLKPGIKASG